VTERNYRIVTDLQGNKIVQVKDIIFLGKQNIDWNSVEKYLKRYIKTFYEIAETKDIIYIGPELPDEYTNSKYSTKLKGALAKAKANAAQVIPEMIKIATNKTMQENYDDKHNKDAKLGWYRFDTRFSIPICDNDGKILRYNVFQARLIVRHAANNRKYLYDVINIKKETEYTV